jgi:protein TonB
MKPESILHADILDIIFDGRNKEYGAYKLRKDYEKRMRKAMLGVSLLAAVIFLTNFWNGSKKKNEVSGRLIVIDSVVIAPPPSNPPPPLEPPKQKIASIKNPTFVLTNDPDTDTMPTVDELNNDVQIGLKTEIGIASISDAPPPDHNYDSGTAKLTEEKPKPKEETLRHAEIMPEFPGGQAAFMRFLSRNLRVPENALEPGQKIKLIVRFVVGKEGELSNMQFLQSSGEVFEHEVLRVLKKMPKWNPGSQNGEKVRVYFNLPIIFDAPEE